GEDRPIPAKGLTGPGYEGHALWDTEAFVVPMLTCTVPAAAASALRWRQSTLPLARQNAGLLDLPGAAFPWRTICGEESSGHWPGRVQRFGGRQRLHQPDGPTEFARGCGGRRQTS